MELNIKVEIDIENLLENTKLSDLKSGKYPFPKEYAKVPEVKLLIQKRIEELDFIASQYIPIRKRILKTKYWKIINKCSNATYVHYVRVNSLLKNDNYGGSFNGYFITFYRNFNDYNDRHDSKSFEVQCQTKIERLWKTFEIYKDLDDGTKIPLTEKEFNAKLNEMSQLVKNEHEQVLKIF